MTHFSTSRFLTFVFLLPPTLGFAQAPATIVQEKTFGGSQDDELRRFRIDDASGDIHGIGSSASANGDLSNNNGSRDKWWLHLDALLNVQGSHSYGSSDFDQGVDVLLHPNGGATLGGNTSGNYAGCTPGGSPALTHVDGAGAVTGTQCLTGSEFDAMERFIWEDALANSYYDMLVNSRSTDGVFSGLGNHGQTDVDVLKYDATTGTQINAAHFGSSQFDVGHDLVGNGTDLAVGGETDGNDHEFAGLTPLGSDDIFVALLDKATLTMHDVFRYGGNGADHLKAIIPRPGGGYIIVGTSLSTNFCGCTAANSNAVVFATNSNGSIDWCHCLQGSGVDDAVDAILDDIIHAVFVVGSSTSTDLSFAFDGNGEDRGGGTYDAYVAALDAQTGDLLWLKKYGGSDNDFGYDIEMLPNGDLLTLNRTSSNDGDVQSGNHGLSDAWIVRFTHTTGIAERGRHLTDLRISPVPSHDRVDVQLPVETRLLRVFDLKGRKIDEQYVPSGARSWSVDLHGLEAGTYLIEAVTPHGSAHGKCVVM